MSERHPILIELDEWLDAIDGDYVAQVEAQKFVAQCLERDPQGLCEFLEGYAPSIFTSIIRKRESHRRTHVRHMAPRRTFAVAAEQFAEDGDTETFLSEFDVRYVVDEDQTRRRVGDMTGSDCKFVASRYQLSAMQQQMLAAFWVAVAKRIGQRRIGDVFTEEKFVAMRNSLLKQSA